ncbi:putative amino acid permease 7 [Nymphaea thermarum]|nr:putative amino acid permease 7 [Nymphaea thermarum]
MLIFAAVIVLSAWLLADCYRSPDPETGSIINHTYMHSVRQHLGESLDMIVEEEVDVEMPLDGVRDSAIPSAATAAAAIEAEDPSSPVGRLRRQQGWSQDFV